MCCLVPIRQSEKVAQTALTQVNHITTTRRYPNRRAKIGFVLGIETDAILMAHQQASPPIHVAEPVCEGNLAVTDCLIAAIKETRQTHLDNNKTKTYMYNFM